MFKQEKKGLSAQLNNLFQQVYSTKGGQVPSSQPSNINKYLNNELAGTSFSHLMDQIDSSVNFLREKTISLVKELRKHSLQSYLEAEIENYLTDVLDQMDLITEKKISCISQDYPKQEKDSSTTFEQLPKPKGDDECFHIQDTYRETMRMPLQTIHELSKQATQIELSSKLQSILSELQNREHPLETPSKKLSKVNAVTKDESEDNANMAKSRTQPKAHRFSNLYLRDVNKAKKGRLI